MSSGLIQISDKRFDPVDGRSAYPIPVCEMIHEIELSRYGIKLLIIKSVNVHDLYDLLLEKFRDYAIYVQVKSYVSCDFSVGSLTPDVSSHESALLEMEVNLRFSEDDPIHDLNFCIYVLRFIVDNLNKQNNE